MDQILQIIDKQKNKRWDIAQTNARERVAKLKKLRNVILEYRLQIYKALTLDFHKSHVEVELTEIQPVIAEINFYIKKLRHWMKPKRAKTPLRLMGTKSFICYEPRGQVLIISPWNYPFHLAMVPLISAVAAGNCVILKPAEITNHTSNLLYKLIHQVFPEEEVAVIEGDASVAEKLLEQKFDHIFFTGSSHIGKKIMEKAAAHLTSITLELGGKTPAIVDESAQLKTAAERILWGKFMNAGQTCVAPDYVFVAKNCFDDFIFNAQNILKRFYNAENKLCNIVNKRHFERLKKLLDNSKEAGEKIEVGGDCIAAENYIAPTIISNVQPNSSIMHNEIFGPILPILTYENINDVIDFLRKNEKPLALYIFSNNKKNINNILSKTTAGGSCINNVAIYLGNPYLPFGGVNSSGIGNYHGFYGFKTFSHERPVMYQGIFSGLSFVYPPYTERTKKLAQWVTNIFS